MALRTKIISSSDFAAFAGPLVGMKVSHLWQGHGSAIFLEFGNLDRRTRSDGSSGTPVGELTLMLQWSWRIEGRRTILAGSWSKERIWPRAFQLLRGATVVEATLFGRLPEIQLRFANHARLLSFNTSQGDPEWSLFKRLSHDRSWVTVKRGDLVLEQDMDGLESLRFLCDGQSPETIARDSPADLGEVRALKADAGRASLWYQYKVLRDLKAGHIHLTASRTFGFPDGGLWTWLAMDAESKLIYSWALGAKDGGIAAQFLDDVLSRSSVPVRVTTEDDTGEIIELVAESRPDRARLNRVFGAAASGMVEPESRILHHRFRELSEEERQAVEDYANGLALSALYFNFVRQRDGRTPAMATGITKGPWSIRYIADMIDMWTRLKTGPWYERVVVLKDNDRDP